MFLASLLLSVAARLFELGQKIPPHRVFCGPTTTSALIGADVDEVMHLIQTYRANDHLVEGTSPDSCGTCSDNSAAICSSFTYLAANNPPMSLIIDLSQPVSFDKHIENGPGYATTKVLLKGVTPDAAVQRHVVFDKSIFKDCEKATATIF